MVLCKNVTSLLVAVVAVGASSVSVARPADGASTSGAICLSRWNSTNVFLIDAVKARLREPASFKHIETKVEALAPGGFFPAKMKYSYTENGKTQVAVAAATLDAKTCKAQLL